MYIICRSYLSLIYQGQFGCNAVTVHTHVWLGDSQAILPSLQTDRLYLCWFPSWRFWTVFQLFPHWDFPASYWKCLNKLNNLTFNTYTGISKCRLWLYMSFSLNLFVSFDKSMNEIYSIFLPKTTKLSMDTYLIWVLHPFDTEHISQVRFPLLVEVTGIGRGSSIGGGHSQNWKINRKQEKFD